MTGASWPGYSLQVLPNRKAQRTLGFSLLSLPVRQAGLADSRVQFHLVTI